MSSSALCGASLRTFDVVRMISGSEKVTQIPTTSDNSRPSYRLINHLKICLVHATPVPVQDATVLSSHDVRYKGMPHMPRLLPSYLSPHGHSSWLVLQQVSLPGTPLVLMWTMWAIVLVVLSTILDPQRGSDCLQYLYQRTNHGMHLRVRRGPLQQVRNQAS